MGRTLTMPKLSDSMEEATILRWLKAPGEAFVRGDPLAEIETDKATIVYEAESDGVLAEIVVPEGATARLGDPIATLNGDSAGAAQAPAPNAVEAPPPAPQPRPAATSHAPRARATPVARRRAVELGVSLFGLEGTGHGGRITRSDVERAAGGRAEPGARDRGAVEHVALTSTQETIAKRMEVSATVPVFTVSVEIDMSIVVALRKDTDAVIAVVPSVNDFVVRAAALALLRFPAFNAAWIEGRVERYSRVNIGIAAAVEGGLLVPTLFDADRKSVAEIATESRKLIEAAKARRLGPDDLSHGTFTVSNLGMFGVHAFTAIVNAPQAAILAVGGIARRPAEVGDRVELRHTMIATLSADHRVVYGADGAAFLGQLKTLLEHPLSLTT
jgi:pyruvate dehydrogenase E2 component (dihydrolipoamide acetyltransferase)